MASCVLCSALSAVYCTADAAFLCLACDASIHSANVISRGHKRLPVCELCKRSPASVYCHEDAAALCAGCDAEVHSANPLPHTVAAIEQAMVQGLVTCAGLPFVVSSRHTSCNGSAAPCCAAGGAVAPAASGPEASACSGAAAAAPALSLPLGSPSDGTTSLAVVPDLHAVPSLAVPDVAGTSVGPTHQKAEGKDLELLDFELAWLNGMDGGFDLSDILGNDATLDGLVPGVVPSAPQQQQQQPAASFDAMHFAMKQPQQQPVPDVADVLEAAVVEQDEFVVPSFLPDDLSDEELEHADAAAQQQQQGEEPDVDMAGMQSVLPVLSPIVNSGGKVRGAVASFAMAPQPPAPAPTARIMSAPAPPPPPPAPRAATRASNRHSDHSSSIPLNGANLTREQRVARYREKRKNRTFAKTIRYASRKAYAEVRPRIKGRFATKDEVDAWKAAQAAGLVGPNDPFRLLI